MSDLNGTLAGLISSANEAKALGNIDDYNKAMNSLGELVATQANQGGKIYDTEASRGNYALMSEAQNAWLADPKNANTIRSWYAPKSSNSGSSTNTLPLTKSGTRKVARATKSQPVQQTSAPAPVQETSPEYTFDPSQVRMSSGLTEFNNLNNANGINPNLSSAVPQVPSWTPNDPELSTYMNNPYNPYLENVSKPLVKQDGTVDLYDPSVPGPKLNIPLPRNIPGYSVIPARMVWNGVSGALSYLNNLIK
jgi:hypothetical protein